MKIRKILTIAAIAAISLSLAACGANKDKEKKEASSGDSKTITVGATPNPHAEILEKVVKPQLEKEGYKLNVKVFNDYILPNKALADGSLDANFYQHVPYLDEYNKKNKTDLVPVAKVHIEPMGIYSKKIKNLKELPDNSIVAVPNDPTNESRALKLLAKEGLIKVDDKALLTKNDIKDNPKHLEFKEVEAAQLPALLPDVEIAVINSNFALEAKLNPVKDSLAIESKDSPYANVLVVRPGDKGTEKIKALEKAMNSPEVKKYIEDNFAGAIVPAF